MYWFDSAYEAVSRFMDMGGNVLWLIALLLFVMWTLIFERVWYFKAGWKNDVGTAIANWESRPERSSWSAHQIREKLISQARMQIYQYLPVIKTMVALCPLLGLLGTVTGMIEVFNIMAVTGGGDAKSMAGGVSRATIPTMAGMVAAISGVFAMTYLTRVAQRESEFLADNLTTDH
ncbi:MAG: MotA/TolQ/ExbB proton channel family protein [Halioglobus sp.]|nr:MotA/TolQ/ExbB proton channel family protein [Halioglobus sp.]